MPHVHTNTGELHECLRENVWPRKRPSRSKRSFCCWWFQLVSRCWLWAWRVLVYAQVSIMNSGLSEPTGEYYPYLPLLRIYRIVKTAQSVCVSPVRVYGRIAYISVLIRSTDLISRFPVFALILCTTTMLLVLVPYSPIVSISWID